MQLKQKSTEQQHIQNEYEHMSKQYSQIIHEKVILKYD